MHQPKRLRFAASIMLCLVLQALGADKYTDENRPYEFGFKIDGQQHRHESKDKDGIIMGEFGFVTADDVYHVTVYATDKEGRFKIVSMKNIHLKSTAVSSLGAPTSARQGHALALPPAQPASVQASAIAQQSPKQGGVSAPANLGSFSPPAIAQQSPKQGGVSAPANLGSFSPPAAPVPQGAITAQPRSPSKPASIEPPARSCSSCSLPTTTTRAPPPIFNQGNENNNYNSPHQFSAPEASPQNQKAFPPSSLGQQNPALGGPSSSSYNLQGGQPASAPSSFGQRNTVQGGPSGSSYNPQGSQQAFPPSSLGQQSIAQGGPSSSSYNPQGSQQASPPSTLRQQSNAQGGLSGSSYNPQGSQQAFPPSSLGQPTITQGGSSGSSYNPQGNPQTFFPSSLGQQSNTQGGPSGSSYNPQGSQQAFPSSSLGQQSIAQGGSSGSSYNPQGSQQASPPSTLRQQSNAQGGLSGSSYNPQGSQQAFPPSSLGQPNIAQGGSSGSSYNPQGSQQAFLPSSFGQQSKAQDAPSGSSYKPQGNQQKYPSGQQNIPQKELVAPDGAPSFAPQPGQAAQNYPGSPNYSQGPGASNVPNNYAQERGAFPLAGPTQSGAGQKASVFGSNNNLYAGAGPSDSPNAIPNAGHFSPNNAQEAGLPKPNAQPTGQGSYPQDRAGERTAKQYNGPEQQYDSRPNTSQGPGAAQGRPRGSAKPTLYTAQIQIVDKNTDIYALGPNEQRGLPPGLSQGDMTQLLYTFNYTLGFHGHFEEGYTNGVKKGYYFVTGRNGVRTRIDYVADDTGFHPKVSQEVLDLLSEDVPKPETEKDEKYGLKGYEFKWLYYPVEFKRR